MKIGVFGSTGFIGSNLAIWFSSNYEVIQFSRDDLKLESMQLAEKLATVDVIINLVGAPIVGKRWTAEYKNIILSSRLNAVRKIKEALIILNSRKHVLISVSAVGIYKAGVYNDEYTGINADDFVADVVSSWESSVNELNDLTSRIIIIRLGIVLDRRGGVLHKLLPVFKLGLAGVIGYKTAICPYISLNDVFRGISFLLEKNDSKGIYNFVSPVSVSNEQFYKALANALNRFAIFNLPVWLVKIIFGESATVLLAGQIVYPKRLIDLGFKFQDTDIAEFLKNEVKPV